MYQELSWFITLFWIVVWLCSIYYVKYKRNHIRKKFMLIVPLLINLFKLAIISKLAFNDPISFRIDLIDTELIDFNKKIFPQNYKDAFIGLISLTFFQLILIIFFFTTNKIL